MSSNKEPSSPGADMARGASEAAKWLSVPIGLVVWVSVFWLTGRWLDGRLDTDPWLQLTGAIVGFAAGFTYVFWAVKVHMRTDDGGRGDRH